MSINISGEALQELTNILDEKSLDGNIIRVFVAGMSCSGPQFNLSLDEVNSDDISVEAGKFTFVVEKDLVDQFGGFEIKYFNEDGTTGIYVEPLIKPESSCSSCGGSCS